MLFHIILFSVVLQSISCTFPPYIIRCPLPDPNANDCLVNSARYAMPYILAGDPSINLPDLTITPLSGDTLILEYNFQQNNTEMQLFGEISYSVTDTYIYEASVNFNSPVWRFVIGGSLMTSDLDFTLNIYDPSQTIQAKGKMIVTQDNWRFNYNGDYIKEQIGNEKYMQIQFAWAYISDDTFEVTYTELTTLDDEPFTGSDLIRVKKALRNFEGAYQSKVGEIGEQISTYSFNTILKLVPENEVFIPLQDQCPHNS